MYVCVFSYTRKGSRLLQLVSYDGVASSFSRSDRRNLNDRFENEIYAFRRLKEVHGTPNFRFSVLSLSGDRSTLLYFVCIYIHTKLQSTSTLR